MWLKKYKPKTFSDYNYHLKNIKIIKKNLNKNNNFIFYGPPGSGKTTLGHIIINHIYQDVDAKKNNVLILNASDERNINIVKTKIKEFCKKTIYKNYTQKIIILDEADMLTYESQTALRKILEDYKNTIFILICNYENKLINPINSRCIKLHFNKIKKQYMENFLKKILIEEKLIVNEKLIQLILNYSNGDFRKSIILIESLSKLNFDTYNIENIENIIGLVNEKNIRDILSNLNNDNIMEQLKNFTINSYSLKDFINIYKNIIMFDNNIKDDKKKLIFNNLAKYDNMIFNNVENKLIILNIFMDYLNL